MVQGASIEMQNCVLQKEIEGSLQSDQRMFIIDKSAASFEDCEILGAFDSSGTILSAEASIVSLKKSGLTVQGSSYACALSAINSKVLMSESHVSSIADTAVNFSMKGGSFDIKFSDCKVISHLGRIIEASGTNLKLNGNKFSGDFDRESKGVKPVWRDENSLLIEDKNNIIEGF